MLAMARQIFGYRDLLRSLIARELKARYRGSLLGFFWSLVNPALLLSVYTFVFGIVFRPRIEDAATSPYALFLVTGLFPWIWVSSSLLEGTVALVQNAGLLRKAVFPAALLPLVAVGSHLVHFLLALPILGAALIGGRLLGHPVGGWPAILLPIIVAARAPTDRRPGARPGGARGPLQGRARPPRQPAHPALLSHPGDSIRSPR